MTEPMLMMAPIMMTARSPISTRSRDDRARLDAGVDALEVEHGYGGVAAIVLTS